MAKKTVIPPAQPLELADIQGMLIRGHSTHAFASYLMLHITQVHLVKPWLGKIAPLLAHGESRESGIRRQIAFTWEGMLKFGFTEENTPGFRVEYIQGMATPHRSRLLGDREESDTENWKWGGPKNPETHILLAVFAMTHAQLDEALTAHRAEFEASGLSENIALDGILNTQSREHFGFRDGISQPIIPGLSKGSDQNNTIAAGEFILGYENAYGQNPDTPEIDPKADPDNILAPLADGKKDFGKNGSYMVFRQLQQQVAAFWTFIDEAIRKENPEASQEDRIALAAKMVGRWPGGAPLAVSPDFDDPKLSIHNRFGYFDEDRDGYRCPIGSHVRRSNPRDTLQQARPTSASRVSNRHRILRRGRNFGPPLAPDFQLEQMMVAKDDGIERGLQFICFNTNISRQFEFVQHTWNDNTKFEGLYNDPDPILGIKDARDKSTTHDFTIQACPVRRKINGLRRFVFVSGGAYFFMPGIRAVHFLAQYNPTLQP